VKARQRGGNRRPIRRARDCPRGWDDLTQLKLSRAILRHNASFATPLNSSLLDCVEERDQANTSLYVFRKFIVHLQTRNPVYGDTCLDASRITSKACYETWLKGRHGSLKNAPKTFQRTLTAHLTKSDGRLPFTPEEEKAILHVIRSKQQWCVVQGSRG
jgi:hypothetical protein